MGIGCDIGDMAFGEGIYRWGVWEDYSGECSVLQ